MEKLYDYLPQQLVTFILVTLFSLLIGLSQRRISLKREGETTLFGTEQSGGKYKTDVVVELPKAGVLSTIINQIKSDDKLKGLFEESKFKQAF